MTTCTADCLVVLDDGTFYIELNVNCEDEPEASGFLQRRCYEGVTTPRGYECVGSFRRTPLGRWQASVDAVYDPRTDSDSTSVGTFTTRMDAIVALWAARHRAYCRHLED